MRTLAIAAALLGACTSARSNPKPNPKPGQGAMTEFQPRAAFRAHAARALSVKPEDLDGGPIDEATAKTQANTVGGAYAYTMYLKSNPSRDVRGWVTADGTVINGEQNLGLLVVELGLWNKPTPNVDELGGKLARLLVWSYGMNHGIVIAPERKMPPPTITFANGAGTLVFFTSWHQSGPGGAGGGPAVYTENRVTLTADHKAALAKTPG
jgi:hypothetical protein